MRSSQTHTRLLPMLALSAGTLTLGAFAQPPTRGTAPGGARAQPSPARPAEDAAVAAARVEEERRAALEHPKTVIQTYNLADMFHPTRDYPFTSSMVPPR